jgi:hypothetical protein
VRARADTPVQQPRQHNAAAALTAAQQRSLLRQTSKTMLLRPHAIHFQTRLSDKAAHFGFGSDSLFVVSPVVQHTTQLLSSTGLLDTVCDQPKDPSSKVMVPDSSPR